MTEKKILIEEHPEPSPKLAKSSTEYCLEDLQLYLDENDDRYPAKEKYDA